LFARDFVIILISLISLLTSFELAFLINLRGLVGLSGQTCYD